MKTDPAAVSIRGSTAAKGTCARVLIGGDYERLLRGGARRPSRWRTRAARSTLTTPLKRPVLSNKGHVVGACGTSGRWTGRMFTLGLALVGFLHLTRGTAVRHVRGVAADAIPIGVSAPEFPLMAAM